jgi:hypothetical protein
MNTNPIEIMLSPLAQSGNSGQFLRLVLAEAGSYGMPGDVIATLDDLAAMLGFYKPTPVAQAAYLAGPLINWRTHPSQPSFERIHEIETLAFKQRALIAFGGGKPGQMVGTAEIVIAMQNIVKGTSPAEYWEIYQWASVDVLCTLLGQTPEEVLKDPGKRDWKLIPDDEVTEPGGRLYPTYQEISTSIRREAIAAMDKQPNHPRQYLRPIAAHFLRGHAKVLAEARASDDTEFVERLEEIMGTIHGMFPGITEADHTTIPKVDVERLRSLTG